MKAKGGDWSLDDLNKFIANPKGFVPGTAMGFAGIQKDSERADVIAYLEPRGPGRTYLKFVSSRGQVLYSTLPDGPALTNGFLAWAPDGKRLAAVGVPGSANASIWIVEPESAEPFRKLIEFPGEVRPRGITWTSDGSSLVFGRQEALSDLVLFERQD